MGRYNNLYIAIIKLVMRLDDVYVGVCNNTSNFCICLKLSV